MNRKGSIPSLPTSITQNRTNTPTVPSPVSTHYRTWKRQLLNNWHSFSTVFSSGTNHAFIMITCSLDFLFCVNNTSPKLLFTTQTNNWVSRSYTTFKFVVISLTIVILENRNTWLADNRRVKEWLLHWFTCYYVFVNCVTASLYNSLHTDTPLKLIRSDASSLSSND